MAGGNWELAASRSSSSSSSNRTAKFTASGVASCLVVLRLLLSTAASREPICGGRLGIEFRNGSKAGVESEKFPGERGWCRRGSRLC
jgi:hypothetical protein